MMRKKKKYWFLNLLLVCTVVVVALAFIAHYKNWTSLKDDHVKLLSGIYYKKIQFSDFNAVEMVAKLPKMERASGFSVKQWEKGIFQDSITGNSVAVYIDDLRQSKIRLVYKDSLQLYLNYSDSIQTQFMYSFFKF